MAKRNKALHGAFGSASSETEAAVETLKYVRQEMRAHTAILDEIRILQRIATAIAMGQNVDEVTVSHPTFAAKFWLPDLLLDRMQQILFDTRNFYEIEQLEYLARFAPKDAVFVDVGANIGNHSIYFARALGARRIHCFEPQPHAQRILTENLKRNALEEVAVLHRIALAAEAGSISPRAGFKPRNLGGTGFEITERGAFECRRLDEVVAEPFDVLKIDVEGMEPMVFTGAGDLIPTHRPIVWVETRPGTDYFRDLASWFENLGYSHHSMPKTRKNHLFVPL